jgi:hypothetical protein
MENVTLTLPPDLMSHLEMVLLNDLDNMTYLLEEEVKQGDPNDEVEGLTNLVLDTQAIITILQSSYVPLTD